jgi:hypothetical protein
MDAALAREPGLWLCPALLGEANALLALGEVGAAIEPLERALELDPASTPARDGARRLAASVR